MIDGIKVQVDKMVDYLKNIWIDCKVFWIVKWMEKWGKLMFKKRNGVLEKEEDMSRR